MIHRTGIFITARKRSFGQGNVFTGVCLSARDGNVPLGPGVCVPVGLGRVCTPLWTHPQTHSTRQTNLPRHTHTHARTRTHTHRVKKRAVHILLECCLVDHYYQLLVCIVLQLFLSSLSLISDNVTCQSCASSSARTELCLLLDSQMVLFG